MTGARALALLLVATTGVAVAGPTPDPKLRARTEAAQATELYQQGRYADALAAYQRAYAILPSANLRFDIGQCHQMLRAWDAALAEFEAYLAEKPDSPHRPLVESLIKEARRERAQEQARQREIEEARLRADEAQRRAQEATRALANALHGQSGPRPRTLFYAGIGTTVGGLALLGIGAGLGGRVLSISSAASDVARQEGTWDAAHQQAEQTAQSSAVAANVLFAVGGAALASGIIVTIVGWRRGLPPKSQPKMMLSPAGLAGVAVTCVF